MFSELRGRELAIDASPETEYGSLLENISQGRGPQ